jgi:hypothetical protein
MIFQNTNLDFCHSEVQVADHVLEQFGCYLKLLGVMSVFLKDKLGVTGITASDYFPNLTNFRSIVWKATKDVS